MYVLCTYFCTLMIEIIQQNKKLHTLLQRTVSHIIYTYIILLT